MEGFNMVKLGNMKNFREFYVLNWELENQLNVFYYNVFYDLGRVIFNYEEYSVVIGGSYFRGYILFFI